MENKTKILAFAAVALMFAVCFIGFVAISDDAVDADGTSAISSTDELAEMYDPSKIIFADGKYTLNENAIVTLKSNVTLNDVKFVGKYTLMITSEAEKHCALTVNYDFKTNTGIGVGGAGDIFEVSSFVLNGADLNVIQKDTGKTVGPKSNQAGCSVFGTGSVEVEGNSIMTITTNEFANRIFYNNGSSLKIDGPNAKVILENATSSTVSLSMTNGATLEIKNPLKTAGNFYPNISNDAGKKVNITVTGAAGNHAIFFYGTNSNAPSATAGVLKNCNVTTNGIVGIYGSDYAIDATGTTIDADSLVAVNATKDSAKKIYFGVAGISNAILEVNKVSSPIMSWYINSVGTKILKLEGVTFKGNTVINSGASLVVEKGKTLTVAEGATISVFGTIDNKGTIVNNGTIIVKDAAGLKTAVDAGGKIFLADNIELDKRITVISKAVTIDLNGKKITAAETLRSQAGAILVDNEGELTINDTSANKTGGIDVYRETYVSWDGKSELKPAVWGAIVVYPDNGHFAKLTVNAGKYKANSYAISGNGTCTTAGKIEININDGIFESPDGNGMYLPHVGKTTINKGTFIAKDCAIEIRAGELSISDGQFKSTATEFSCNPNGNGATTSGAVIAIAQHTTKKDITVNISGGVFEGLRALNESNPQNNDSASQVKLSVTGGTFKGMIQSVDSIDFITGGSFSDLSGLAYVAEGKTYNLVEDCVVNSDITVKEKTILSVADSKSITIDAGKKLTIQKDATFNGTILGPNSNKLVANGMKAGNGGITITGGSLIINGKIMDAGGSEAGVTVTVTGDGIKISGSLDANVTMVIEKDTIVTVKSGDEFSFNGTITNNGTLRIEDSTTITTVETSKVVNNGVVVDERAKNASAVPVTNDGTVVAKNNADKYKGEGVDVVEQDPDKPVATEGKIEVNTNKYAFITPVTTTGKLNVVMNDGYKQYTVTIPEGTAIAAGTVISVSFIEYQSDSVTRYQINTPGIENFSMKLPCQIGFKKAKVYCDDSELGVSKVRYDAGTGYVTFDASHNSVFTIVLSNVSPAGTTTVSGGDTTNDYSLVIAFVVLVASLGFLAYVIKKR